MTIDSGETVIRLIHPIGFNSAAPRGAQLVPACLQTKEFEPRPDNKGPSLYLKSALPDGIKSLEAACPKWSGYGYAELIVKDLERLGLTVIPSSEDCHIPSIRQAHCSLLGVTRANREAVVEVIEAGMLRAPTVAI